MLRCKNDSNIDYSQGIVALVLARGGSKGIPLKNLAKIDNISMLGRALRIIKNCNCFVDVWVSTDSNTIAQEAYRNNVNVHYRSEYSARDEATSVESIQEFLSGHPNIKNIALIQCTSVFLNEYYLDAAVKRFVSSAHIDCVFSAYRCFFYTIVYSYNSDETRYVNYIPCLYRSWKLRWKQEMHSTHLEPINFHPKSRPRRQDWQGELVETGMFYFFRRNLIQTFGLLQSDG